MFDSLTGVPAIAELQRASESAQRQAGYFDTLHEICHQPATWADTAARAVRNRGLLQDSLTGVQAVVLTGSGSSLYAGECLAATLQHELGVPVQAVGGGDLLTHGERAVPPNRPLLMVSLARSGNSPESCAAVDRFLESVPDCRHLAITCNHAGRLANHPRVRALVLDDRTNDRSLVMTSSFTNMVTAGRFLGTPKQYEGTVACVAKGAEQILAQAAQKLAETADRDYRSAVYLGSGVRFGAAREAALKVLEMTAGRISTFPETYLGLRHGPMSAIHRHTMVVCFLSSDKLARAYELDLIAELNRKQLSAFKVIAGDSVPMELLRPGDVAVSYPAALADEDVPVLDVLVGQLLAFFRCRSFGLKPDTPSENGVITRVVEDFRIHRAV